jgi:choline dehydrogenase
LEAGGSDRNFWLKLPVGYYRTMYNQRFARLFATESSEVTGNRLCGRAGASSAAPRPSTA